jgi:hypothetical protein
MPNLFEINDDMEQNFSDAVTALIEGIKREITLIYLARQRRDCPNCLKHPFSRRSGNIYDSSNPNPTGPLHQVFSDSDTCPICSGRGYIEDDTPNHKVINMAVINNPTLSDLESLENLGPVKDNTNQVYTLGYWTDKDKVISADHAIIEGRQCKRTGSPSPLGLKSGKFMEVFWEVK